MPKPAPKPVPVADDQPAGDDPIWSLPPDDPRLRFALLIERYPEHLRARMLELGADFAAAAMMTSTHMKAEDASSAAFGPNLKPWARTSPPHLEPSASRTSPPRAYPYISHTSHTFAALAPSSPKGSVRGSSGHVTDVQRL